MKVCEVSGGFDSALSALMAASTGARVWPIYFDYGQKYERQERAAAQYVVDQIRNKCERCERLHVAVVDMQVRALEGTVSPYVPIRNLVFCALSANYAQSVSAEVVTVGSKTVEFRADDPYCFRDCTSEFYEKVGDLVRLASESSAWPIRFEQPLVVDGAPLTKREVLLRLEQAGFDLRRLWSCYSDTPAPCHSCYHCKVMAECVENCSDLKKYAGVWG